MSTLSLSSGQTVEDASNGEPLQAFVPAPLPPALSFGMEDLDLLERANRALGRLDGVFASAALPAGVVDRVAEHIVRTEALRSTQMEGAAAPYADLLAAEAGRASAVSSAEGRDVVRHVAALAYGERRIRGGVPLSLRLIREVHEVLIFSGGGGGIMPGLFRSSQVWVGGTGPATATFVPPPPGELMGCLEAFERFLGDPQVPVLLKAALAHVQFETIHPFLDGNGRVGRLLIALQLAEADVLARPVLPLSGYFAAHRAAYAERLQRVRTHGEWGPWLRFFLTGVWQAARQARGTAEAVLRRVDADAAEIATFGRGAASAQVVYADLQRHPVTTIPAATARLALTFPTVQAALARLEAAGIVRETTAAGRGRAYVYTGLLELLDAAPEAW